MTKIVCSITLQVHIHFDIILTISINKGGSMISLMLALNIGMFYRLLENEENISIYAVKYPLIFTLNVFATLDKLIPHCTVNLKSSSTSIIHNLNY